MFQNPLFVMSLSGTVIFILYLLMYPLAKRYFSIRLRYRILKLSLIFYLLPFPFGKYEFVGFLYQFFPSFWKQVIPTPLVIPSDYIIVLNQNSVQISKKVQYLYAGIIVFGIVSFAIIWKNITLYWKMKRVGIINLKWQGNEQEKKIFCEIKNRLGIKRNVKFICSQYCSSPMTTGIWAPVIIFPISDKFDIETREYMIKHELVHIKHNDVLIKLAGIFTMAMHWYNPFVYLLMSEISCISEMYCDSVVMDGKGERERKKYGELLLTLVADLENVGRETFFSGLTSNRKKKTYERRILEMKGKKYKSILTVPVTILICIAGASTALAYNSPVVVENLTEQDVGTELFITTESIKSEPLVSDYFFTSDDGNVHSLSDMNVENRRICIHDYSVPGTVTEHKKNSNGGCTIKRFEALICAKCNAVQQKNLISTTTYENCPH